MICLLHCHFRRPNKLSMLQRLSQCSLSSPGHAVLTVGNAGCHPRRQNRTSKTTNQRGGGTTYGARLHPQAYYIEQKYLRKIL